VNSYDEALSLPTEEAVKLAVRVQQVLAKESGVADTIDPIGGSYYLEWLTDELEECAWRIIDDIDDMGGMTKAVEKGYPQRRIADSAHRYQRRVESGEIPVIGVNVLTEPEEIELETHEIDEESRRRVASRLRTFKTDRDQGEVEETLWSVAKAAERNDENLFPHVFDAVKTGASVGEISGVLRDVWGEWKEHTTVETFL
jgi:methylmalonyl-CoA mutase N-terminal domain/subunit